MHCLTQHILLISRDVILISYKFSQLHIQYTICLQEDMFSMLYKLFSLIYFIISLVTWIGYLAWKLVITLVFISGFYFCLLRIHQACKCYSNWVKKIGENMQRVSTKPEENYYQPHFHSTPYEDDIRPEDSVSVVSAFSSKDSQGSAFENIETIQV